MKFKASCPEIVTLGGLQVTTQFSKDEVNEDEVMDINKIGDKVTQKCFNYNKIRHL